MKTLQRIQKLPESKREQILWAIVAATLALLLLLWVGTSQIPRRSRDTKDVFTDIRNKINKARAEFPK